MGGLGANAIEKRLELSRQKTKVEQEGWERKYGKDEKDGKEGRDGRGRGKEEYYDGVSDGEGYVYDRERDRKRGERRDRDRY